MIADIRKHMDVSPFVPFRIRTTDGQEYPVPTIDHIYLPPGSSRVVVSDDEGIVAVLPSLHISGLLQMPDNPARKIGLHRWKSSAGASIREAGDLSVSRREQGPGKFASRQNTGVKYFLFST